MTVDPQEKISEDYPGCRRALGPKGWELAAAFWLEDDQERLSEVLSRIGRRAELPPYLVDLARLDEFIAASVRDLDERRPVGCLMVNPSLKFLELSWSNLLNYTEYGEGGGVEPAKVAETVLLWRQPGGEGLMVKAASDEDLLALKIILEDIPLDEAALAGGVPVGAVDQAVARAVSRGLLLAPPSKLVRAGVFPGGESGGVMAEYFRAGVFTLQWHLTQACDLSCRHCYDRSSREQMGLEQGIEVLDGLRRFCRERQVTGQVSFSGGNPLLYPHFFELYREAAQRGFSLGILGNPASREQIDRIVTIAPPAFFQVSLEGLPEHNDYIRGAGHFARIIDFLVLLREFDIYSMVMLTLSRDNMGQVIPLLERLDGLVDSFTFNRLAMVGEGARLKSVDPEVFMEFLEEYRDFAGERPWIRLKDNLFGRLDCESGVFTGGCTGYGCGAAFNFMSLLPDGEVHACRKFPSPVGNIHDSEFSELYDSRAARRYRLGSSSCRGCVIRPVCGACLAVTHGFGLDISSDPDPYCPGPCLS